MQAQHTRYARDSLQAALDSKDWDRATMFAVALRNSQLHGDVSSLASLLQGAPQSVHRATAAVPSLTVPTQVHLELEVSGGKKKRESEAHKDRRNQIAIKKQEKNDIKEKHDEITKKLQDTVSKKAKDAQQKQEQQKKEYERTHGHTTKTAKEKKVQNGHLARLKLMCLVR